MTDYINVNLATRGRQYDAKIEQGCSFENNGSIYRADESGKLKVYDKAKGTWSTTEQVKLTNYQLNTFRSVANQVREQGDYIILSQSDVKSAIREYKRGGFIKSVSRFLQLGYIADNSKLYSKYNTLSVHVTNGHCSESNMLFGYGSRDSAIAMSQIANKTRLKPENLGKIRKTTDNDLYWVAHKDILYRVPRQFTISETTQNGVTIANKCGISFYRLKKANPLVNFEEPLEIGSKIKIPGRYFIKPGSVKNFNDVVRVTGLDRHYINDILIGIEGRHSKPDLKAYYDGVADEMHPKGFLTIGFGHTGRVNGKILTPAVKITEPQAYEILAQDILDAKLDAIVYMGKENFSKAPKSIQTGIIDIVFNKGVEPFDRLNSPTSLLKSDLKRGDYASAAADMVLGTTCKGLKKRNIYRAIMSMGDLATEERKSALIRLAQTYENTQQLFDKTDRMFMNRAWKNAKNGVTHGFFPMKLIVMLNKII